MKILALFRALAEFAAAGEAQQAWPLFQGGKHRCPQQGFLEEVMTMLWKKFLKGRDTDCLSERHAGLGEGIGEGHTGR